MNLGENGSRINLNDIANISEEDFKQQITAWIDSRGISHKLQSKLRADLFDHFNRTQLGRQMCEQHHSVHRIVLSPLILVLNTLVAEFLYAEDCHFTLSVFSNEVPYKNTLPNFEATPARQIFRFAETELQDIFEAIGLKSPTKRTVRKLYADWGADTQKGSTKKSLLYCLFKVAIQSGSPASHSKSTETNGRGQSTEDAVASTTTVTSENLTSSASPKPKPGQSSANKQHRECQMSARCFKYVNRYLDILSDRIHEISKNVATKRSDTDRRPSDSSQQESSLKKDLRKMIDNFNRLTKSKRESQRFQDVLSSIERLSTNIDKCSENMNNLIDTLHKQPKVAAPPSQAKNEEAQRRSDRLDQMDYGAWLKELKTSANGKKFIERLESSLQKTMQKERDKLDKFYEEKTANYRMLIRLHYKQKYAKSPGRREAADPVESSSDERATNDHIEKVMAESLTAKAVEKEQHLDHIVQGARDRLQQLERESEHLDDTFKSYMRRQQNLKQQSHIDISNIWQSYNSSKAAIAQFNSSNENIHMPTQQNPVSFSRTEIRALQNNGFDDDDEDILRSVEKITRAKSPDLPKNGLFAKAKSRALPLSLDTALISGFGGERMDPVVRYPQIMQAVLEPKGIATTSKITMADVVKHLGDDKKSPKLQENMTAKLAEAALVHEIGENTDMMQYSLANAPRSLNAANHTSANNVPAASTASHSSIEAPYSSNKPDIPSTLPHSSNTSNRPTAGNLLASNTTHSIQTVATLQNGAPKSLDEAEKPFPVAAKPPAVTKELLVEGKSDKVIGDLTNVTENLATVTSGLNIMEISRNSPGKEGVKVKSNKPDNQAITIAAKVQQTQQAEGDSIIKVNDQADSKPDIHQNGIKVGDTKQSTTESNAAQPLAISSTSGFSAAKKPAFTMKLSDSDDMDSAEISIGAARAVKSPDDYWI